MAKKKTVKTKQKPVATPEQIQNIVYRYNRFNKGNTPEQIYRERDAIHEEMANYSNVDAIQKAMVEDRDKSSDGESYVIIPKEADIFPGYQPTYEENEYGDRNVSGYEPIPGPLVPEGAVAIDDDILMNGLDEDVEIYPPDFKNSYMYYYYPKVQDNVNNDQYEDNSAPEYDSDTYDSDTYVSNVEGSNVEDYINSNYDLFGYQNAYYDLHNSFDYLDPEVATALDTYKLTPAQLQTILSSIYDVPVDDSDEFISSEDYAPKVPTIELKDFDNAEEQIENTTDTSNTDLFNYKLSNLINDLSNLPRINIPEDEDNIISQSEILDTTPTYSVSPEVRRFAEDIRKDPYHRLHPEPMSDEDKSKFYHSQKSTQLNRHPVSIYKDRPMSEAAFRLYLLDPQRDFMDNSSQQLNPQWVTNPETGEQYPEVQSPNRTPKDPRLLTMEEELYDGLGIYWDRDAHHWSFDPSFYDYSGSYDIPEGLLLSLEDSEYDYESIYFLYDRLLTLLKYPNKMLFSY